jgi:hypothetical protein
MDVRYERLVLESDGRSLTLDLHPRLTVLAGLGPDERQALAAELLGALRSRRGGVHVELVDDTGRHLAVFRPTEGKVRVIDVDRVTEVTGEFLDGEGHVDLLHPTGLDLTTSRRKLVLAPADVQAEQRGDAVIRQLAALDQGKLWTSAELVLRAERNLDAESQAVGASAEDAELIARIEDRHHRLEAALERHERIRRLSLAICATGLLGALVAVLRDLDQVAVSMVMAACISMLGAVYTRNQANAAGAAEAEALAEAGATSYLGFHMQRVEEMLTTENARKRLLEAAAHCRTATEAWHALAGDVAPMWALDHYEEIASAAAARREIDLRARTTLHVDLRGLDSGAGDPARVLVDRITEVSHLGEGGESYPLILDDPFVGVDAGARPAVLELLAHAASSVQLIYLTGDEAVASWARLEALTGALAIIEPAAQAAPAPVQRAAGS